MYINIYIFICLYKLKTKLESVPITIFFLLNKQKINSVININLELYCYSSFTIFLKLLLIFI